MIIASAGLVTIISSKARKRDLLGDAPRRPRSIGSPSSVARAARSRWWTSSMNGVEMGAALGRRPRYVSKPGPSASTCRARPRPTDRPRTAPRRLPNSRDSSPRLPLRQLGGEAVERGDAALPGRDRASVRPPRPARHRPCRPGRSCVAGLGADALQRAGEAVGRLAVLLAMPRQEDMPAAWSARPCARPRRAARRSARAR